MKRHVKFALADRKTQPVYEAPKFVRKRDIKQTEKESDTWDSMFQRTAI